MRDKILITMGVLLKIIGSIVITIILFSFINNDDVEDKAVEYIKYLNENKIRGGCFYIKNDSVTTFKNYKQ